MFGVVFWKLISEAVVVLAVVIAWFYMGINGLISLVSPETADKMNRSIEEWLDDEEK